MNRRFLAIVLTACGLVLLGIRSGASSAELSAGVRFDRDIQPILARCVQCHGPNKPKAGLRLDSRAAATAELESGNRAVVPRHPEQSELLRRVSAANPRERM